MVRRSTHRSSKQKDTSSTPAPSLSTSTSARTLYRKEQPSPSAPRNRSTTESSDKYGSMMGGNQMATIAEGAGTLSRRKSNASDDGFKVSPIAQSTPSLTRVDYEVQGKGYVWKDVRIYQRRRTYLVHLHLGSHLIIQRSSSCHQNVPIQLLPV